MRFNWRIIGWGAAIAVLLLPWIAMQFTDEVMWTSGDFIFAGLLVFGIGTLIEIALRLPIKKSYRITLAVILFIGLLLIWAEGAVGIFGE